jgi:ArsR family transcriptional regulator, arsenate/arsenite/antimonite-responsive transcriptional repressor
MISLRTEILLQVSVNFTLMSEKVLESQDLRAAGFHALAEPWRIQIIEQLRQQELCVCELLERMEISQSKLSFHLKVLREAELIKARQSGRWIYYSLNLTQFVVLEEYLAEYRRFSPISPAQPCAT